MPTCPTQPHSLMSLGSSSTRPIRRLNVCVGGYVRCLACGASIMLPKEGQRLAFRCVPKVVRTSGSFYRVRRIAQGLHPYGNHRDDWPNGVVSPMPTRVAYPRPSVASQRAIRRWRWFGLHMLAKATAVPPNTLPPRRRYTIQRVSSTTWIRRGDGSFEVDQGRPQGEGTLTIDT